MDDTVVKYERALAEFAREKGLHLEARREIRRLREALDDPKSPNGIVREALERRRMAVIVVDGRIAARYVPASAKPTAATTGKS